MTQRTSKRLKAAAEKAITTATATVVASSTTRKTAAGGATTTVTATKTRSKKTTTTAETITSTTDTETTTTATGEVATTSKTAKKATGSGEAVQAAWGALFKASAKTKTITNGDAERWPRPKAVDGISEELRSKIDEFAAIDGVTKTRAAGAQWKLVAWNVNGLRAVLKKDDSIYFRAYVAQEDPDVLCLSETKIDSGELQKLDDTLPQYPYQYWSSAAKKGYAGTVVFSKTKPLSVKNEIIVDGKADDEGRFLALEYEKFWLVHTYVPNAGVKLDRLSYRTEKWDKAMLDMLLELEKSKPVVWCGDLNVAHEEIDIHDPKGNRNKSAGFTDAERESFGGILKSGFVDTFRHFHPDETQYTYFSYRFNARAKNKGWRIDYFVTSKGLVDSVVDTFVRDKVTGSDHVPIGLELKSLQ